MGDHKGGKDIDQEVGSSTWASPYGSAREAR